MQFETLRSGLKSSLAAMLLAQAGGSTCGAHAHPPADSMYRNGYVYTVDSHDSVQQAIAIRGGRIVYVGSDAGSGAYLGRSTQVIDLHGRMVMPGIVDGHMHPLQGGAALLKCNLNYERLTVAQMQARIQSCLDTTRALEPDGWLEVVNWFQEAMLPAGTLTSHATLDTLKTHRPIFVMSSFGHTVLANLRSLALAGVRAGTVDPLGGRIGHDAAGQPSGILEDAAYELITRLVPSPTQAEDVKSALAALDSLRKQGITSFLDADASPPTLAAFDSVRRQGRLTARAHMALLISPPEGRDARSAVARAKTLAQKFDGPIEPEPGMTVRNVKLFLDGVISAPALTGAMLEPYWAPTDSSANAIWAPSKNRGPDVYFPAPILSALLIELAGAGFDPHMHADGDRAVHEGLDGIEALRRRFPSADIRTAIAHNEIVAPADFPRFRQLDVIPVLSFQWEKPAPDTIDNAKAYMGAARFKYMEPAGVLAAAGARVAFGSDWPVDALDEWFALQVAVTRTNSPQAGARYAGRLSEDVGLTRAQALRAITMNSSYELHQDKDTGSIEIGKFADLIVLDRNVLEIPAPQIASTQVLQTVVGGRVVYQALGFKVR